MSLRPNMDARIRELQQLASTGDRDAALNLIQELVRSRQPKLLREAMEYLDDTDDIVWAASQFWNAKGIHDPNWWHVQVYPYEDYAVLASSTEAAENKLRDRGIDAPVRYPPALITESDLHRYDEDHIIRRRNPERPFRFYHVSLTRDEPAIIMGDGLIPRIGPRASDIGETRPAIYLFGSHNDMDNALMGWLGEELENEWITEYEITLPQGFPVKPAFEGEESWEWVSYAPIPSEFIQIIGRQPPVG